MDIGTILIGILAILFIVFGLRSFIDFLEDLVTGLLKIAAIGIVIAIVISLGQAVIP